MIVVGKVSGGKFAQASPAGFDVQEFYLARFGGGVVYTATTAAAPSAPPALYEASAGKTKLVIDPATTKGMLHDVQIGRLRFSPNGGHPSPLFFLGRAASGSQPGADLYFKNASNASPITKLTASKQAKPEWFEPGGTGALATRAVNGSTEVMSYLARPGGGGLWRSADLCTIPGYITDGHGPGSMATNGGRYAYFEYPRGGGPAVLKVGGFRFGMMCKPRWSLSVGRASGERAPRTY